MCYTEDDLVIRTSELVIYNEIEVKNLHELNYYILRLCNTIYIWLILLKIMKLSFNSTQLLVRRWLFDIQLLPCSVSLNGEHSTLVHWGSNSIWHAKKAKVSLVRNEQRPNRIALHSNSNTTFKHAQVERKNWNFLPKNQWENIGPPTKKPIRSQENSNVELNHQIVTCELLNNSHDYQALKFDGVTYTSWRQKPRGHTTWWMCNV